MIFVTIGVMYGFERLIVKMDEIAGKLDEEVIMQIGETVYEPKNASFFRFMSREEMDELYQNARLVVCHAGVGSIIKALEYNKPIILVPRIKKYQEHINDHQLEIAKELEREGMATVVYDIEDLEMVSKCLYDNHLYKIENLLVERLRKYLEQMVLRT